MKPILFPLIASILLFGSAYQGSTVSAVVLAGGVIKAKHVEVVKKYKRKDCPVCKGTGKYLSGDGIKMVDCGYCEPDKKQTDSAKIIIPEIIVEHPPIILHSQKPQCTGPECQLQYRSILKRRR